MTNLHKYEHIIYENSDFMSQNWDKINQKFVWLNVASIKISHSIVPDCAPFLLLPFYEELPYAPRVFLPRAIYENVDIVFMEIYGIH
jgi:hypothetical protein